MKILGKRFWTWMSVWAISFFVRGELATAHPADANPQEATSSSGVHAHHKIPAAEYSKHKVESGKMNPHFNKQSLESKGKRGSSNLKSDHIKKEGTKTFKVNTDKTSKWHTRTKMK